MLNRRSLLSRALGAIAGAVCAPLVGRGAVAEPVLLTSADLIAHLDRRRVEAWASMCSYYEHRRFMGLPKTSSDIAALDDHFDMGGDLIAVVRPAPGAT